METLEAHSVWSNRVVLRNLFQFLPTQQLITLSRVNKLWYHETRCYLRDRRIITEASLAIINGWEPCRDAFKFSAALENMEIIPYNGLNLILRKGYHHFHDEVEDREAEVMYSKMWTKMKLKFLRVDLGHLREVFYCPFAQLVINMITTLSSLEHLHVVQIPPNSELRVLLPAPVTEDSLKKLKYLELSASICQSGSTVIAKILSVASNLKEIKSTVAPVFLSTIPPASYRLVKSLDARTDWDQLSEFAAAELQLQNIKIRCADLVQIHYWQNIWDIIERSRASLESIELDQFCVMLLRQTLGQPLKNVRSVCLCLRPPPSSQLPEILFDSSQLEQIFDLLEHLFPSAASFSLVPCQGRLGGQPPPRTAIRHTWPRVTRLTMMTSMATVKGLSSYLRYKFPSVRALTVEEALSHKYLWEHWSDLEELHIIEEPHVIAENWDATFCGISEQEAEFLQTQNDEFLRNVHIVPPFPAVTHLKNLRILRISLTLYKKDSKSRRLYGPPELHFISKVTTLIAFNRMLKLTVELHLDPKNAHHLKHLKPLVKLTKV